MYKRKCPNCQQKVINPPKYHPSPTKRYHCPSCDAPINVVGGSTVGIAFLIIALSIVKSFGIPYLKYVYFALYTLIFLVFVMNDIFPSALFCPLRVAKDDSDKADTSLSMTD